MLPKCIFSVSSRKVPSWHFPKCESSGLIYRIHMSQDHLVFLIQDIVCTPPSLPVHIPVKLECVVGPPSDDELQSAHASLRISDYYASRTLHVFCLISWYQLTRMISVASVFDADLSMQLSQHLFDLQLG